MSSVIKVFKYIIPMLLCKLKVLMKILKWRRDIKNEPTKILKIKLDPHHLDPENSERYKLG